MDKFKVGKEYSCRSICDYECVWLFNVIKRTAKSIWIKDSRGDVIRKKISLYDNTEIVYPLGRYSMCPVLKAN
jgi:hypothetical protein